MSMSPAEIDAALADAGMLALLYMLAGTPGRPANDNFLDIFPGGNHGR